ncbi:MAG: hypothetical protein QW331_02885 [Candidatus Woesearchaeota archaeon]
MDEKSLEERAIKYFDRFTEKTTPFVAGVAIGYFTREFDMLSANIIPLLLWTDLKVERL